MGNVKVNVSKELKKTKFNIRLNPYAFGFIITDGIMELRLKSNLTPEDRELLEDFINGKLKGKEKYATSRV